ncbi:hypothetical protein GQ43DRAFT_499526, partial [Delitschia confertaspora ATCC 74209]
MVGGSKVVPWDKFAKTIDFLITTKQYHHLRTNKLRHIPILRKHPGIYKTLWALIKSHRFCDSTDPRDKSTLFSVWKIRDWRHFETTRRLWYQTITLAYRRRALRQLCAIMSSYRNLLQLSHEQDPSRTLIPNLPSWVPDYAVDLNPCPLRYRGNNSPWKAHDGLRWRLNPPNMQ